MQDGEADISFGTRNQTASNLRVLAQAVETFGEPSRTRTQDPLIKRLSKHRSSCGSLHTALRICIGALQA